MTCPNKNDKAYKEIENIFGEDGVYCIWKLTNGKYPTLKDSIKILYGNKVKVINSLSAWSIGSYSGKNQKEFEPEIDDLIKNDPNAKVGGGESFNQVKERTISAIGDILKTAPDHSVVVTHSTVLKFLKLWNDLDRPKDLSKITPEEYLKESTSTGDTIPIKGKNGTIHFVRHGKTDDNEDGNLRSPNTQLTEKGIKDAKKAAEELSKIDISQLYTSPLDRTIHTSDIIMSKQLEKNFDKQSNNIYQQKNIPQTPKQLKYELQSTISQTVSGRGPKSKIQDAIPILRRSQGTVYQNAGTQQKSEELWRQIQNAGLEFTKTSLEQQQKSITQKPNDQLDEQIKEGILKSIGIDIQHEVNEGQSYNAFVDTVKGIISVVAGKADIKTLPHEATHMFLDMLPEGSKLLDDIIHDIKRREQYDDIYEQYKDDPQYQNENGSVNEEKIAKEAAAHIIDDVIVGKFLDAKSKKWWEKLWDFIKKLFTGKSLDSFEQVANDILGNKTKKLSKEKLAAIKEANERGEIYYQLSDKDKELVEKFKERGVSGVQNAVIDTFVKDNTMTLGDGHVYKDAKDPNKEFTPVSTTIKGKFEDSIATLNRNIGIDFHTIMQDLILGKTNKDISETTYLKGDIRGKAISIGQEILANIKSEGDVLLPEVILSDKDTNVAGTTDVLRIKKEGLFKIIDFKTSKYRVLDSSGNPTENYMEHFWEQKPGSWLDKPLTTNLQHGIQLNCYNRMVAKLGKDIPNFNPFGEDPETHHIFIEFESNGEIKNLIYEGFIQHPTDSNRIFVDKILGLATLEANEIEPLDKTNPDSPIEDPANGVVDNSALIPFLKHISNILSGQISKTIDEVGGGSSASQLSFALNKINNLTDIREQDRAMNVVMNYVEHASKKYDKFINDKGKFNDPRYYPCLTECIKIVNQDLTILPEHIRELLTDKHKEKFDRVRSRLNKLNIDANLQASNYVKEVGGNHNPFVTDKQVEQILWNNEIDTSHSGLLMSPKSQLASHQVQHMAIVIKDITEEGNMEANIVKQEIADIAKRNEQSLGRPLIDSDFDKFYKKDKSGKLTHQLLIRVGDQYRAIKEGLESALIDDDGNYKEYIPNNSKEAIEYNKELYPHKEAMRVFRQTETLGDNGLEQGRYHHLSQSYIDAQHEVMQLVVHSNYETGEPLFHEYLPLPGKEWKGNKDMADRYFGEGNWEFIDKTKDIKLKYEENIFKIGDKLPADRDPDLVAFRDKYQDWREYLSMTKAKNGQPTGIVVKKSGYFPKREYTEVNDKDTVSGKDLRDENWKKLQGIDHSLNNEGRVWLDIYNSYTKYMSTATEEMGADWNDSIQKGGTLALSNKYFKTASKDGNLAFITHNLSELWGRVPKGKESTDIQGVAKMEIRKIPLNNFKNATKVQELRDKLTALNNKKETMTIKDYNSQRKELTDQLNDEDHKTSPVDMERNLLKAAIVYCAAAKGIKAQKNAEGQLLALQDTISGRVLQKPYDPANPVSYDPNSVVKHQKTKLGKWATRYGVTDSDGNPVWLKGYESNTVKAIDQLMRIFYDVNVDHGQMGKFLQKMMSLTSIGVMTNPITNTKNLFLYQVTNSRAAIVSKYYPGKYYRKAVGLFMTDYLPGAGRKLIASKDPYQDKRPQSFMEAFMRYYSIGTKDRLQIEGQGKKSWTDTAFAFETMNIKFAEYSNIAGLALSEQITNSITGETVNAYEQAHDWNPNTGEFKLKPGINPDDLKKVILKGRHIQLETQGNYERIEQPLAKEFLIGSPLFQFRQFLGPAFNQMWSKPYNSLMFGDVEGTWQSVGSLINFIRESDGDFREKLKNGWNNLSDHQKRNLYFDMVQIGYLMAFIALAAFLKGIAEDIDSDNETQKRWANLLVTITNTMRFDTQMETPGVGIVQMAEFMQNPVAISTTLKSFAQAIYLTTKWPFQDEDERNYKNGVFVGDSKAAYQWKKTLPGLKAYQRWQRQLTDTQVGFWQ